jgi:hypothetical protein
MVNISRVPPPVTPPVTPPQSSKLWLANRVPHYVTDQNSTDIFHTSNSIFLCHYYDPTEGRHEQEIQVAGI